MLGRAAIVGDDGQVLGAAPRDFGDPIFGIAGEAEAPDQETRTVLQIVQRAGSVRKDFHGG